MLWLQRYEGYLFYRPFFSNNFIVENEDVSKIQMCKFYNNLLIVFLVFAKN